MLLWEGNCDLLWRNCTCPLKRALERVSFARQRPSWLEIVGDFFDTFPHFSFNIESNTNDKNNIYHTYNKQKTVTFLPSFNTLCSNFDLCLRRAEQAFYAFVLHRVSNL